MTIPSPNPRFPETFFVFGHIDPHETLCAKKKMQTTDETTTDWIIFTSDATTMDSIPTDRPNMTETTTVHESNILYYAGVFI